jgi:hypothetical protein
MRQFKGIPVFNDCPALDGYHCQTNSLAKMFHFNMHPISEEMLLGLGAGMNFIYWHMKGTSPFIGGRGNTKNFFQDIGRRTGVGIEVKSTSSEKRAEKILLDKLRDKEPVMVYGDMGFLPWFDLPEGYHFGGHTFVVCGYDGKSTVVASDIDQKASGLKKGFYHLITLEQLRKARGSSFKPFPPKNTYLEFDFNDYRQPGEEDLYSAIEQMVDSMLNPPISNLGIKGLRRSAEEILKWPEKFKDEELRMNLFMIYVFIEISGTGGGCFRYMYSRFLKEAAEITNDEKLEKTADGFYNSGRLFTKLALLFKNPEETSDLIGKIDKAAVLFNEIADLEEKTLRTLK